MNLFYEDYPSFIRSGGEVIPIRTDFRDYIRLMDTLRSKEVTDQEKAEFICSFFLKIPPDVGEAIGKLMDFINMDALDPPVRGAGIDVASEDGTVSGNRLDDRQMKVENGLETEEEDLEEEPVKMVYSFEYDYAYILAGFRQCYQIDLRTVDYMHWWEFRCLFQGLPADTEIKQRIRYRGMDLSKIQDKEERKRIRRIQDAIRLPGEEMSDYEIGNAFM